MKKFKILLILFILCVSGKMSAQYASISLHASSDTLYFGDNGKKSVTTRLLNFEYDTKLDAAIAQVSMDIHHLNPFDLPEVYVNGKLVHVNVYFPSLAVTTKFYFFKVKSQNELVVNSPIGNNHAKLSFLLSPKDLVPGKNSIRLTVGNRTIDNLDDFAVTNAKVELRGRGASDNFTDYAK